MQFQIDELIDGFPSPTFDSLREATDEEVDPVLNLDDVLFHDQLFALVPANLGQETLDRHSVPRAASFAAWANLRFCS